LLFLYLYQTKNKIILSLESKNTLPGKKSSYVPLFPVFFFSRTGEKTYGKAKKALKRYLSA